MYKKYISLYIVAVLFSCTTIPRATIDSFDSYKIKFKKLKQMKNGVYGMGSVNDGRYIYSVNGSVMGKMLTGGLPFFSVDEYGEVSGSGSGIRTAINQTKHIYRYDPQANLWSVNSAKFRPKSFLNAEFIDGEIYIFNGQERMFIDGRLEYIACKNLEIFDVKTGEVDYGTNIPYPTWYSGSAVWNNKVYVFGGNIKNGVYSDKLLVYDPYYDKWSHLSDMPVKMHTRGEIVNGSLYIFGGYNGAEFRDIYKYDISEDEWSHVGYMPRPLSSTAITKHGDFIWMIGDYTNLNQVAVFNTNSEKFNIIKSNMYGRRHAGAEIIGNKLYVYGGNRDISGSFLASIQAADISEVEKLLMVVHSIDQR